MGHVKWQWLAAGLPLLVLSAMAPVIGDQSHDTSDSAAAAEESAATEADSAEETADCASQPLAACPLCGTPDRHCPDCPLYCPALEQELAAPDGTDASVATEIPAGSLAPANEADASAGADSTAAAGAVEQGCGLEVPPLWTPSSGRFPLTDRPPDQPPTDQADSEDQDGIELVSDAEAQPADALPAPPDGWRQAGPTAQPAPDPAVEPAPAATSSGGAAKPATPLARDSTKQPAAGPEWPIESLDILPLEGETDAERRDRHSGPAVIPSELLDTSERASAETDTPLTEAGQQREEPELQQVGVIPTRQPRQDREAPGGALEGLADRPSWGWQALSGNPWRSVAIALICLALLSVGLAAGRRLRGPPRLDRRGLHVIENISIGAGRQITIVELGETALVLGVTPRSINVLDKVPLALMHRAYRGTIDAIINREVAALPADWAQRPLFEAELDPRAKLPPPTAATGHGPGGPRPNVGELRRSRAADYLDELGLLRPLSGLWSSDRATKAELIRRLREQLNKLED